MFRANWNGQVIAEATATERIDGYTYFPREAVRWEFLTPSPTTTACSWKGTASYFNVVVNGQVNANAAWSYQTPKPAAAGIKDMIGFWRDIAITH